MKEHVPVPPELIRFITSGSRFIIAGHKEPDGDCVGSQLALCSALRRLGKTVIPCSSGPFKRTEVQRYEDQFLSAPGEREKIGAQVIVLDCSMLSRLGDLAPHLEGLPLAIIDHHAAGEIFPSSPELPVFLDPHAPSSTFMVFSLIEALGLSVSKEEADLLLLGLCTDTGFFRHLDEGGAETFFIAAKMLQSGASPKKEFQAINGGKSLNSRILMGHILSRAESLYNGRLIFTYETLEDTRRFGLEGRDSDSLYQLLQSVAGMEAIVIVREETPDRCTVGLRSRDSLDVAAIAAAFGGGGHRNAAGASVAGTLSDVKEMVIKSFAADFD
ncbi:MAG: bifunctional oligoribonuclease/PAP phosphatase NrnA [Treponema sp.]|jgi:phosphoesterase RecJ-like protein|nr:bifunctional oligoribonuclease/PAP phosphatase NrnA [Treponema sp.]